LKRRCIFDAAPFLIPGSILAGARSSEAGAEKWLVIGDWWFDAATAGTGRPRL
jgi:hypothetical protein